MNEFATELTNVMTPDYIEKLGMSKAPFSELHDADVYYENDNKINIQKKIAHLLEYTNLVLFVQGAEGVGKTTILKQRILTAKTDWQICYLSAKDYTTPEAFINKLTADLNLNQEGSNAEIISLQEKLEIFCKSNQLPILIIDDIEQLKETLIPILSSLTIPQDNNRPLLRLIISGDDISPLLLNAIPKENNEESLKYLPVLPLTEAETGEYIKFKIKAAGYEKNSPFTATTINNIYLDAKGFPKYINQLANHFLTQFSQGKIVKPSPLDFGGNNNVLKLAAIGLSLLVAIIVIISVSTETDVDTDQETENLAIPATPLGIKPNIIIEKNEFIELTTPSPTPEKTINAQPENVIVAKDIMKNPQAFEKRVDTKAPEIKPHKTEEKKPTAPQNRKRKTATQTSVVNWINKQNPNHFTLQLIGGSHKAAAEKFIKEHNIKNDAYIFSTTRNGTPWFVVIYKSYSQRTRAQAASDSLPKSLKKMKPWIRTFAQIKKDMK